MSRGDVSDWRLLKKWDTEAHSVMCLSLLKWNATRDTWKLHLFPYCFSNNSAQILQLPSAHLQPWGSSFVSGWWKSRWYQVRTSVAIVLLVFFSLTLLFVLYRYYVIRAHATSLERRQILDTALGRWCIFQEWHSQDLAGSAFITPFSACTYILETTLI